jgi:hypothetical protein
VKDKIMSLKSIIPMGLMALACATSGFAQQGPDSPRTQVEAPLPELTQPVDAGFVPPVESKTQALQVLSASRRDPFIRIKVRNVSDKRIYSFRLSYHRSGQALLYSFIMSDSKTSLSPGEVYKCEYPFIPDSIFAREPLTFEAVLFEDGTGDGDADKVKSLQDLYLSNRKELEHVIALLQSAIDTQGVESSDNLRDLQLKVSEIPDYIDGLSLSGLAGITLPSWRRTAMHLIQDIQRKQRDDTSDEVREELNGIKERFSKQLAKFPGVN